MKVSSTYKNIYHVVTTSGSGSEQCTQ